LVLEKNADKRKPTDELLTILADNVRQLRKEQGLTQEDLGDACDFHPTFISLIERKQRNVTISTLEVLARALGVKSFELLKDN